MHDISSELAQVSGPGTSAHHAGVMNGDVNEIRKAGHLLSNRNIYIIEDDPSVRNALVRIVAIEGLEALTFDTAETFLAELSRLPAGSLIVDVQLPNLNGLELLNEMARAGIHWPAVLISGSHEGYEDAVSSTLGPNHYLRKPFEPDALLRALRSVCATDNCM